MEFTVATTDDSKTDNTDEVHDNTNNDNEGMASAIAPTYDTKIGHLNEGNNNTTDDNDGDNCNTAIDNTANDNEGMDSDVATTDNTKTADTNEGIDNAGNYNSTNIHNKGDNIPTNPPFIKTEEDELDFAFARETVSDFLKTGRTKLALNIDRATGAYFKSLQHHLDLAGDPGNEENISLHIEGLFKFVGDWPIRELAIFLIRHFNSFKEVRIEPLSLWPHEPGYHMLNALQHLKSLKSIVLGGGFPVVDYFVYQSLQTLIGDTFRDGGIQKICLRETSGSPGRQLGFVNSLAKGFASCPHLETIDLDDLSFTEGTLTTLVAAMVDEAPHRNLREISIHESEFMMAGYPAAEVVDKDVEAYPNNLSLFLSFERLDILRLEGLSRRSLLGNDSEADEQRQTINESVCRNQTLRTLDLTLATDFFVADIRVILEAMQAAKTIHKFTFGGLELQLNDPARTDDIVDTMEREAQAIGGCNQLLTLTSETSLDLVLRFGLRQVSPSSLFLFLLEVAMPISTVPQEAQYPENLGRTVSRKRKASGGKCPNQN